MKKLFFGSIIFLVIATVLGMQLMANDRGAWSLFDRTAPAINFEHPPTVIGLTSSEAELQIADDGSGLEEAVVTIAQGGEEKELLRKSFGPDESSSRLSFKLPGREFLKGSGEATIRVTVRDRGFWKNSQASTLSLRPDFDAPQVEALTVQHNVSQGGVSMAFYRIKGDDIASHGVRVGDISYAGFKAAEWDAAFSAAPDVYFAFFIVPFEFEQKVQRISAFGRDQAGNETTVPLNFRLAEKPRSSDTMKLTEDYIRRKVHELIPGYLRLKETQGAAVQAPADPNGEDELIAQFRLLNEDYRQMLDLELAKIFSKSEHSRLWKEVFVRPLAAKPTASFLERRSYVFNGRDAGKAVHNGTDLASVNNDVVRAANDGKIAFTGDLGIYGNTVIIDHGFGLFTLYGHLSSITCKSGDPVKQSDQIGRTGQTGFAGGDHLHYEVRLNSVPVTPIEWWDPKWIKDHIDEKTRSVGEYLGVMQPTPSKN